MISAFPTQTINQYFLGEKVKKGGKKLNLWAGWKSTYGTDWTDPTPSKPCAGRITQEAKMVDVYELASRLFARDFEGISEDKCRAEAKWALRSAQIFVEECEAVRASGRPLRSVPLR